MISAGGSGGEFLNVGDGAGSKSAGEEGTDCDGGGLSVFPGAAGFDGLHFGAGDGEDSEVMHATGREDIDALFAVADGKFESSVEHDGGVAAGDFDTDGAVAFLDEGAGPDKKVGVWSLLRGLARRGFRPS